jgi:hypothetical protein
MRCPAGHFCCAGCLQAYVRGRLEVAVLRANEGRIPCYEAGQGCAHQWTVEALQEALDKGTHVAYSEALLRMLIDGPKEAASLAAAQAAAVAAAARLALGERVAALRRVIVERDLLLRCPHALVLQSGWLRRPMAPVPPYAHSGRPGCCKAARPSRCCNGLRWHCSLPPLWRPLGLAPKNVSLWVSLLPDWPCLRCPVWTWDSSGWFTF